MATIGPKQASPAQLISDLATELSNLSDWSDADSAIVNDQSDNQWENNARVFENSNTNTYLLFYVSHSDGFSGGSSNGNVIGIRIVHSADWDTTNNHPSGDTNVDNRDPMSGSVSNLDTNSFNDIKEDGDGHQQGGLWVEQNASSRSGYATNGNITYLISARNQGITFGAYNTTNSNDGGATWYNWEYLDNKFWNDGNVSSVIASKSNRNGVFVPELSYGFQSFHANNNWKTQGAVGNRDECVSGDSWGFINPDAGDDTFFFRRPAVYATNNNGGTSTNAPVAFLEDAIPNLDSGGGANGDTVTFDGTDYRIFDQKGAGMSTAVTAGIRFE